jgi:ribosomal protein L12E/L44/L45/RPP1/RPP2
LCSAQLHALQAAVRAKELMEQAAQDAQSRVDSQYQASTEAQAAAAIAAIAAAAAAAAAVASASSATTKEAEEAEAKEEEEDDEEEDEELRKLRALFDMVDADGSGELDREEVSRLSKDMGAALSDAELDTAMSKMDQDGSGLVDFDEFRSWYYAFQIHR